MQANELHPYGTYVSVRPNEASCNLLVDLQNKLGLNDRVPPNKLHVTITYSKRPCPAASKLSGMPAEWPAKVVGFERWQGADGSWCLVAKLDCKPAVKMHHHMREEYGATHDYPDFTPHVTLSYNCEDRDYTLAEDQLPVIVLENLKVKPLDLD